MHEEYNLLVSVLNRLVKRPRASVLKLLQPLFRRPSQCLTESSHRKVDVNVPENQVNHGDRIQSIKSYTD